MGAPNQGTAVIGVGIDPHKKSHTAVAVSGATGEVVGVLSVRATDPGHRRLVRWVLGLDADARVALDHVRHVSGRLERALVESGIEVARVPPRLMGQARRSGGERGTSDPIDATAVARAGLAHPQLPAAPLDGPEPEIHLLLSHREARRCLKRHLVDVIFRTLHSGATTRSTGERPCPAAAST
jgi:transposase